MKEIELYKICDMLNIDKEISKQIIIKSVVTTVSELADNTLLFHLHKTQEIDDKKFKLLHDCYVVTDQPTLLNQKHLQKHTLNVTDIDEAYKQFINYYRNLFSLPIVAITGTCGKTTTKEIIKQVIEKKHKISATIDSKNSLRFTHDYLMSIDDSLSVAVFETGLTHPGDLIYNCNFYKPEIGVITNIGIDHLTGCKTFSNYIRAKGEMLAGLRYKGVLIINSDDNNIKNIDFAPFKGTILTFGIKDKADFYGTNIKQGKNGINFRLIYKNKEYEIYMPGLGEHNVYNALGALAVLKTLGLKLEESISHLTTFKHVKSHLEQYVGYNNSIIFDDTWSSNPTSVKAAFESLNNFKNPKIAVLGNIAYLGDFVLEQCKEIGKMLVDYKFDYLVAKDRFSKQIGKESEKFGMNKDQIFYCNNEDEIKKTLESLLKPKTVVLFKMSMLDKSMVDVMKYFIKTKKKGAVKK